MTVNEDLIQEVYHQLWMSCHARSIGVYHYISMNLRGDEPFFGYVDNDPMEDVNYVGHPMHY